MRSVRVTFDDGDSLVTSINGTKAEVLAYYIGNQFNLGQGGEDHMATATEVEFLQEN